MFDVGERIRAPGNPEFYSLLRDEIAISAVHRTSLPASVSSRNPDRPAWVAMPSEEDLRRALPFAPYDFGFLPAMTRLVMAHDRIGPFFGLLFGQIP